MSNEIYDYAIIGAGLTGLSLGWDLSKAFPNLKIRLLDKAKSCGGRIATRRINELKFDHGAQFIKNSIVSDKWIQIWNSAGVTKKFPDEIIDAICGISGMTQLPKVLAQPLDIKYDCKLVSLSRFKERWVLQSDGLSDLLVKNVVMTCPLPQALEILNQSKLNFNLGLSQIGYARALVILIESSERIQTELAYQEKIGESIYSICSQTAKSNSDSASWTVVMTSQWSEANFDKTDDQIMNEASALIKTERPNIQIQKLHLKKWKYSHPKQIWPKSFETPQPGLYLAGDAFGGPSLLGSLRSSSDLFNFFSLKAHH